MTEAAKIVLVILGILALYAIAGTLEFEGEPITITVIPTEGNGKELEESHAVHRDSVGG